MFARYCLYVQFPGSRCANPTARPTNKHQKHQQDPRNLLTSILAIWPQVFLPEIRGDQPLWRVGPPIALLFFANESPWIFANDEHRKKAVAVETP